jgi:hypothetical protein
MSRSFKRIPVQTYSGKGRSAYKRHLNRRLRHLWDIPSGGAYRRVPHDHESLWDWGPVTRCFTRRQWDEHVQECWDDLGTRFLQTETDVLRAIRRPRAK